MSTPRIALLIGVGSAAVTAAGSWIPSLWGDEAATVLSAERSLPSLWEMAQHLDAMHATYYLLMHFWIAVFGASTFSVRFPSALAVGAGAAGVFVLLRMLGRGRRMAVLAAVLFVCLPRIQYVGQEARSFAWDAGLVTWTLVAFVATVHARLPRRVGWVLYGVGAAVSTMLFPFNLAVVLVSGVTLLPARNRRCRIPWAVSSGLAVLAASPVLVFSFRERGQVAYLADTPVTPAQVLVSTWFGDTAFAAVAWALVVVALTGWALRSWGHRRMQTQMLRGTASISTLVLLATWAFMPAALLLVTQPFLHNYAERYVAYCAPAVGALLGEGIVVLAGWRRTAGFVAAACVLAVAVPAAAHQRTPYSESGSDWAQLAKYVHAHAHPGQDIVFAQTVSPSKWARNSLRLYPQDFSGLRDVSLTRPWYDSATTWRDTALSIAQTATSGRVVSKDVWVVETRGSGSEGLPQLDARGYRVVRKHHFDLDTVYELAR